MSGDHQGQGHGRATAFCDSDITCCCSVPHSNMAFFRVWIGASSIPQCGICVLRTTQPRMVFLLSSRDRQGLQFIFSCLRDVKSGFSQELHCRVWPFCLCWKYQPASINHMYQHRTCQSQLALQRLILFWQYLFFPNNPGHPTQTVLVGPSHSG